MKAIKTYLSVYPKWYRIFILIVIPLVTVFLGMGFLVMNGAIPRIIRGVYMATSAIIVLYAEFFGEYFTLGDVCVRKGAFGDMYLSSSKGRVFVKDFAKVDALRRLFIFPILFGIQQMVMMIIQPEAANLMDGIVIGFIFAFANSSLIWVIRKTRSVLCRVLALAIVNFITCVFGIPYILLNKGLGKGIISLIIILAAFLVTFLAKGSVIKCSARDYYDE